MILPLPPRYGHGCNFPKHAAAYARIFIINGSYLYALETTNRFHSFLQVCGVIIGRTVLTDSPLESRSDGPWPPGRDRSPIEPPNPTRFRARYFEALIADRRRSWSRHFISTLHVGHTHT